MLLMLVSALGYLPTQLFYDPWEMFNPVEGIPSQDIRRFSSVWFPDLPGFRARWSTSTWGVSLQGLASDALERRDWTGAVTGKVRYTFVSMEGQWFSSYSIMDRPLYMVIAPILLYEQVGDDQGMALGFTSAFHLPVFTTYPLEAWTYLGPFAYELYSKQSSAHIPIEGRLGVTLTYPTFQSHALVRLAQQSGVGLGVLWWPHRRVGVGVSYQSWLASTRIEGSRDVLTGVGVHMRFRLPSWEVAYTWRFMGGIGDVHGIGLQWLPE